MRENPRKKAEPSIRRPESVFIGKKGNSMKSRHILSAGCAVAVSAMAAVSAFAQTTVSETTTSTSEGTIDEFVPSSNTIVLKTERAEPVRYVYSTKTVVVDDAGNPASMEIVKSGLPVTVYYTR